MQKKEEYSDPAVEFLEIDDVIVASGPDPDPGPGGDDEGDFEI